MGAMEDWAGGLQLQHSLYGSRGRTRVSVYKEYKIFKVAVEDRAFRLAIDVGLRCKLVLTCEPAVPHVWSGIGSKGSKVEGPYRWTCLNLYNVYI
jgi:hypothetical protein